MYYMYCIEGHTFESKVRYVFFAFSIQHTYAYTSFFNHPTQSTLPLTYYTFSVELALRALHETRPELLRSK